MHWPTVVSAGFCPKATAQTQVVNLRPTKTSLQESLISFTENKR